MMFILRVLFTLFFSGAEYFILTRDNQFRAVDAVKLNKKTLLLRDRLSGTTVKRKVVYAIPADPWQFLFHPIKAKKYLHQISNVNVPTYFIRDRMMDQW